MNSDSFASSKLEIRLLGAPQISHDGVATSEPLLAKAWAILYYLAATNAVQPRAVLADLLWGNLTESSRQITIQ